MKSDHADWGGAVMAWVAWKVGLEPASFSLPRADALQPRKLSVLLRIALSAALQDGDKKVDLCVMHG